MAERYKKPISLIELESLATKQKAKRYPNVPQHAVPKQEYCERNTNGLTKAVIDLIQLNGYQAERINSMGRQIIHNGKSKWIKGSSTNGTADISATIKGRAVKIEIKCKFTGDRYQSEDQKRYAEAIANAGGIYIIVREFDWFYKWFTNYINH